MYQIRPQRSSKKVTEHQFRPGDVETLTCQASEPIFAPQLIGARLQGRGGRLHPWLTEVPCDPKWAQEWPVLEKCPWPKLEQLVASLVATGILTH